MIADDLVESLQPGRSDVGILEGANVFPCHHGCEDGSTGPEYSELRERMFSASEGYEPVGDNSKTQGEIAGSTKEFLVYSF